MPITIGRQEAAKLAFPASSGHISDVEYALVHAKLPVESSRR